MDRRAPPRSTAALRVLAAHGLQLKSLRLLDLPLNEALIGLLQRQVDALIQVIGAPADSVRDALTGVPLRLPPLSERAVATLVASNADYFAYTIPRGTYAAQTFDSAAHRGGQDFGQPVVEAVGRGTIGGRQTLIARRARRRDGV